MQKFTKEDALRLTLMPRHARRAYAKILGIKKLVGIQDSASVQSVPVTAPNFSFATPVADSVFVIPEQQ